MPCEFILYPITQHHPGHQECQGRTDSTGKRDQKQRIPETKQCAARQGHYGGTRNRQCSHGDIHREIDHACQHRVARIPRTQLSDALLQNVKLQELAKIEVEPGEKSGDDRDDHNNLFQAQEPDSPIC